MSEAERLFFIGFMFIAGAVAAALGLRSLQLRHKIYWAGSYMTMCTGGCVWLAANVMRMIWQTPLAWKISSGVDTLGISLSVFGLFLLAYQISGRVRRIPRLFWWVFIGLNTAMLLSALTNDLHHLTWRVWMAPDGTREQEGPIYVGFLVVIYSLIAAALFQLARTLLTSEGPQVNQAGLLLAGAMVPVVVGVFEDVLRFDLVHGVDEAAIGTVVAVGIFAIANLRYGSFTILPVAYRQMFDSMQDGLVVLDEEHHIVSFNPAARKILTGLPLGAGVAFEAILSRWSKAAQTAWQTRLRDFEIEVPGALPRTYRITTRDLIEESAASPGRLVMIYDITEQKQLEIRLHELAINDSLTGCFNRGHFMECAAKQFRQSVRYRRALSVAMIDLDHFKTINDQLGHAAGDRALRQVTAACLATLRRSDIFARYGGEEFVVMMPETDAAEGVLAAERLREAIAGLFLQEARVTVSIGVATLDETTGLDLDRLLDRADKALYISKEQGRNRVTLWKEPLA